MTPLSAPFAPGLPPAGAGGAFIGRDAQGNTYLLRWHEANGWEALGWVQNAIGATPTLRHMTGDDQGLIVGHCEIAGAGFAAQARTITQEVGIALFDALTARGVDPELIADAAEAAADKSDQEVAALRAKTTNDITGTGAPAGTEGAAVLKGGTRPADRHPEGVRALGPSPALEETAARLRRRLEERQRAAAVNAEWLQVPVADVLADATLGVLFVDLAALLAGAALHGPFGHLVGAIGLDESHWRIEDSPCAEPGYFSLPMFTQVDPLTQMQKDDDP